MDFDLFMEKYGYKLLGLGIVILIAVVLGFPLYALWRFIKEYPEMTLTILIIIIITSVFLRGYFKAYGEAMGKYFYDDKFGKRP
ncbi:hypothetical protein [Pyrococcus kukulkanii]|uniref:Uncharacterized protein n=1 Tax=Pyrococcus kukulkanii TaxID=1609559 RepID=A0ABV4T5F9_9EURY